LPAAVADEPRCVLPPNAAHALVLSGARVFDGIQVTEGRDLLIEGGLIRYVGSSCPVTGPNIERVDARGLTVMPGLIDAHIHAGMDAEALARSLVFGVTTAVDMFGPSRRLKPAREARASRATSRDADMLGSGILATCPGGHGTEYGFEIPTLTKAEEAQAFVDARIASGSDFLKIVIDTEKLPKDADPKSLAPDLVAALATAAHARGIVAHAHIGTMKDTADAVNAGVDGVEHMSGEAPVSQALADEIAKRHVTVTPTLGMNEMRCGLATGEALLADAKIAPLLNDGEREQLHHVYKWANPKEGAEACMANPFASVRMLNGKTPILAGTDAPNGGNVFGASLHHELELLVRAGLSPREALVAATSATADAFRMKDRGRVAVGLVADLVLVEGDPTVDIKATRAIRAVYKRGIAVERAAPAAR
jgi:imidazolonepropionase-like amidohydrolase